jgi:hypothetical protein
MLTQNPFATAAPLIPGGFLKAFLVVMILAVILGTIFDMVHKGSARFFFANMRKAKARQKREVGGGELVGIAIQTALVDVATSGEFCNPRRRVAHLLTMYGFILHLVSTVVMIFSPAADSAWAHLWWIGGLMVLVGGYWFWFFIRVDVAAEGSSPLRLMHADLFVLSLLATVTFGLIWAWLMARGSGAAWVLFALYVSASLVVLVGGVPWSKFAHMFFKPAAAFEKRVAEADGTNQNLPMLTRDDPEQQARHSMELLRDAPMDMGLGIKREAPRHY